MDLYKIIFACIVGLTAQVGVVYLQNTENVSLPSDNIAVAYIVNEGCAPRDKFDLSEQLYNSVIIGDYETAVMKSFKLENEGRGTVIANVVSRLLDESKSNTVEFAYKLWNMFGKNIVKDYFPISFRLIIDENLILITNKNYGLALNLDTVTDEVTDRLVFGDGNDASSNQVSWRMYTLWEKNRLYFKIKNIYRQQYVKLEIRTSSRSGDHKAWSSDDDESYRHQWYLRPVKSNNDVLFYIYNRKYDMALKLDADQSSNGNRQLWGHNGKVTGNVTKFGWTFTPI